LEYPKSGSVKGERGAATDGAASGGAVWAGAALLAAAAATATLEARNERRFIRVFLSFHPCAISLYATERHMLTARVILNKEYSRL
jgi:hypothetical protein